MNRNHVNDAVIAIKQAIDENPLSREILKALAPEIYVGRNQLQSAFKQITGKTIRRYRLEKRMEAAAHMLTGEDTSIKEVAIACGHAECVSSFSKMFRAVYKMSPEEWMRKSIPAYNIRQINSPLKKCI